MRQERASANVGRRFNRLSSCDGKFRYSSYDDAKRQAKRTIRLSDDDDDCGLSPYHCKYCGRYHIGHRPS